MSAGLAYFEGRNRPLAEARVGITSQIFNYGLGAFSGIRGYWNDEVEQLFLFRVRDHFERLVDAGRLLQCDGIPGTDALVAIATSLLRENHVQSDVYCRAVAYKGEGGIGARLHDVPSDVCMFLEPMAWPLLSPTPLRLVTSSWQRIPDTAIPARAKICGAYVNVALARSEARSSGFDDALCLDRDGHVAEAPGANVFVVRHGRLCTPPVYGDILEGITRRTVIEIALEMGLEVEQRPIDRSELFAADEAFLCGTARGIAAIAELDRRPLRTQAPGELTQTVGERYATIVRGQVPEWRRHCHPVYTEAKSSP